MRAAFPLLVALCTAPAGCGDGKGDEIQYTSSDKPIGHWPAKASPAKPGESDVTSESSEAPGTPSATLAMDTQRGDAAIGGAEDSGAAEADDESQSPAPGASKPTGPAKDKDAGGAAARVTFSVLTQVQHMRLSKTDAAFDDDARGPKNMGAIWISKPDGTFLRSLEVWRLHKERARHLLAFNKACECPKPDVTATATLNKHKPHTVSWDMSDRDGAHVPEGKYTLHIEVADYDVDKPDKLDTQAMNAQWSVDFDTHDAPKTIMPEAAPFFTNLELALSVP